MATFTEAAAGCAPARSWVTVRAALAASCRRARMYSSMATVRATTARAIRNQYGSTMRTIRKEIVPSEWTINATVMVNVPSPSPRATPSVDHR